MKRGTWISIAVVCVVLGAIVGVWLIVNSPNSALVIPTLAPTVGTLSSPSPSPIIPTVFHTGQPTPVPPKVLTICQAEEPNTLFTYGGPSRAARNVLEAIYDGPIDTPAYQYQPTILEKLPSPSSGDAVLRTVQVEEGGRVIDVNNEWAVPLGPGTTVLNAGGQEVTFESGAITMTQLVVTFTLRASVTWEDGHALTADDSVYAFELAKALGNLPPHARLLLDRTQSYEAVDARTVVWTSVPGYSDTFYFYGSPSQNTYVQNFFSPLPRHFLGMLSADQMLDSEIVRHKPLGWGPFAMQEWVVGDHITLVRNARYFRASEGLPYLDSVTFRFVPDLQQALDLLAAGECDVITSDVIETGDIAPLLEAAEAGTVQLLSSSSSEWEHLDFGITPASWVRRPDYFGDVRVRQAIAQCVDRERIAREASPYGEAVLAHSYVPAEHPFYTEGIHHWGYDPAEGRALLEEVGWQDGDGDGVREARGVAGVAWGTPFSVTLVTTSDDPARKWTAQVLTENLADCGIVLGVQYFSSTEALVFEGYDSPVLGRQSDLALYSWNSGLYASCELYLSSQIPAPENQWTTLNSPGYASADYDAACQTALGAPPGSSARLYYHGEAQRVFAEDLPALPLYFVPRLIAVRPGVSGVAPDPSEYLTWNIETFDVGR
ncbi:MAG: peptide ABC transporter substrate-binding protein [Anaerolineae bacterium]|nr:peptide ABC transporter substrate-binding protein [Anaerolineae bacterium]